MKVHVICCNDSIQHAVLDDPARAEETRSDLKEACWERHKALFDDRAEYERQFYWHVRITDGA